MSDLFGVEVPEVTGLHNLLTLACETASLVGDTGLFPKLRALLTMAAWNKDRSEGLERGEIERMILQRILNRRWPTFLSLLSAAQRRELLHSAEYKSFCSSAECLSGGLKGSEGAA